MRAIKIRNLSVLLILLYQHPFLIECKLKTREQLQQGARASRASGSGPGGHLRQPRKSYLAKIVQQAPSQAMENVFVSTASPLTEKQVETMIDPVQQVPMGRSFLDSSNKPPRQASLKTADKNWYIYKPDQQFGRMIDTSSGSGGGGSGATGGGSGSGGGGSVSGSGGGSKGSGGAWGKGSGGKGGGGGGKKKPYNVQLLQKNQIDPSGYTFFQYRPDAKVGVVYYTKNPFGNTTGRISLTGGDWNGATDIDDLDEANSYDWEFRRYDRACLYVEFKLAKKMVIPPPISLETLTIVKDQNTRLARKFLEWTFVAKADEAELLKAANPNNKFDMTFEFLSKTKEIFLSKICRNASEYAYASATTSSAGVASAYFTDPGLLKGTDKASFLPDTFIQLLYNLFMVLRDITSTKTTVKEYPTTMDKEVILDDILKECADKEPTIHWFKHSCGDQLYDPVLDTVWHMFNAVHSYCFEHFQKQPRMWHRYALIMANTFTEQMRLRWTASAATESFYMRLLGPEYPVYLETINRCMYGSVLRSDAPMLLPRFDTPSPIDFAPKHLSFYLLISIMSESIKEIPEPRPPQPGVASVSDVVSVGSPSISIQGAFSAKTLAKIDPTSPEWHCSICHQPCTQQCSLCKEVAYCGKAHQREDWKSHKLTCRGNIPVSDVKCKVIYDYDSKGIRRGRNLITTKGIKQGEIIMKELPLVWVPKHDIKPQPFKSYLFDNNGGLPSEVLADPSTSSLPGQDKRSACIVCGELITQQEGGEEEETTGGTGSCSLCKWPVCSDKCERELSHERECQIFQGNHIPRYIQQLLPNRFLFVLRCLLLQHSEPKKWKHLMELEYNPDEMTKKYSPTDIFSGDEEDDVDTPGRRNRTDKFDQGISKLLRYYGIKCEVAWVTHLMKVIKWNVIYDYEYDSRAMLFHLSSAAKHSCLPNVEAVFKKTDGRLYLRALVDLKPGEPILISRDPLATMLTAQVRQRRLKYLTGWEYFRCSCARCADWTELGTNFATLKCRKTLANWGAQALASVSDPPPCTGLLHASRPLDQAFEWKCPVCKFRVSGDLTKDKLSLKNLLSQVFHYADPDPSYIADGVKTVESFGLWFHPQHSFLFQTKMRIMDTINLLCVQQLKTGIYFGDEIGIGSATNNTVDALNIPAFNEAETIELLVEYGTECQKTAEMIFPGVSRIRGHILLFLGFAKWTLFKVVKADAAEADKTEDFVQFERPNTESLMGEAKEHLDEARKILTFFKDVKEEEKQMVKFAYLLARKIDEAISVYQ
ncbi:hypothetical protein Ocin01_15905 [Orchesella cincta]|uniref:Protein msta n=1 Tax=Orchesella cincta TaxID=48709 RepID=A0A1D2MCQ9_ORCCI|nr:hypothetical protein Ocin01_15905 [Orchesella cincta]